MEKQIPNSNCSLCGELASNCLKAIIQTQNVTGQENVQVAFEECAAAEQVLKANLNK